MQRFKSKTVLVTGAGSGIGRAAALRMGAEGGNIYCVDLDAASASDVAGEITAAGGAATAHACDVSDEAGVKACVEACVQRYGGLYALVNMAGLLRFDATEHIETELWQKVLQINLTGTLFLCRETLPHLVQSGGSIVNAASTAALQGLPCGATYSATKGGVLAMTRSIAVEFAKRGVRANCVCPGDIQTNMTRDIDFPETMDFELMPRISSLTGPRGPETVAGVIAMLASVDGIHITGEHIRVDGGTLS